MPLMKMVVILVTDTATLTEQSCANEEKSLFFITAKEGEKGQRRKKQRKVLRASKGYNFVIKRFDALKHNSWV